MSTDRLESKKRLFMFIDTSSDAFISLVTFELDVMLFSLSRARSLARSSISFVLLARSEDLKEMINIFTDSLLILHNKRSIKEEEKGKMCLIYSRKH